ncbi:MAG: hypothetical protein ACYSWU_17780 [Planctomycetota bacterium]
MAIKGYVFSLAARRIVMKARLSGGPYDGVVLEIANPTEQIGLGVDDVGKPDESKPPIGLVIYKRQKEADGTTLYELLGFKRRDAQPYLIEFVDGPAKGVHPAPRPTLFLDAIQRMPILADDSLFRGIGEIAGEAVYERRQVDGVSKFYLVEVDRNAERVKELVAKENTRRLTEAMQHFYEKPDYGIYSKPATDNHPQELIEVRHRRAHVDEKIAPLIKVLWEMEMDTLGSCQQIYSKEKVTDKAYVAFPRQDHARHFEDILKGAGIDCTYERKNMTIAGKSETGELQEKLTYDTANVKFLNADIDRIVGALKAAGRKS